MNSKFPSLSRRQFLLFGGGTALSALLGGAYLTSACPLSNTGICVGPCAAYIDFNHDGICDRIQNRPSADFDPAIAARDGSVESTNTSCVACPFGIVNDPYPGKCRHYVDANNNGLCDLSEADSCADETLERPVQPLQPQANDDASSAHSDQDTPCTACPFGLVDDPYPGECRYYVDHNGNGLCDLSEAGSCADETLERPVQPLQPQASDDASSPHGDQDTTCTACPFGLVDDPYPGQCRYYVDNNGNGLCDLSEPGSCADETLESPSQGQGQGQGGGQRRRGQRKDGQ